MPQPSGLSVLGPWAEKDTWARPLAAGAPSAGLGAPRRRGWGRNPAAGKRGSVALSRPRALALRSHVTAFGCGNGRGVLTVLSPQAFRSQTSVSDASVEREKFRAVPAWGERGPRLSVPVSRELYFAHAGTRACPRFFRLKVEFCFL